MTSDKHDQTPAADPQAMPKKPTLAEIREFMDDLDIGSHAQESEAPDPLAASWRHMQESRGWK